MAAIKAYKANGNNIYAKNVPGKRNKKEETCWCLNHVPKVSFYDALKWELKNKRAWDGSSMRDRGKTQLLSFDMEEELIHWAAVCQRQSGGVDVQTTCRVGFAMMTADPEHHAKVKAQHPGCCLTGLQERTALKILDLL